MFMPPGRHRPRLPFAPAHRCWSCGEPIDAFQAVSQGGVCTRFECRAAESRRRQAEDRRVEARRRDVAREHLTGEGLDPDRSSWSVTPYNDAELVALTAERREAFLTYLRRTTREAVEGAETGPAGAGDNNGHTSPPADFAVEAGASAPAAIQDEAPDDDGRFGPPDAVEGRGLAAACATCRGWCCRQGGTHAFLKADRIRRLLRERPDLEPDDVPSLYEGHLGERHLQGGCVFQGETGCRLPRELRSDTCNEYFCPDLVQVRRQWRTPGGGPTHRFMAVHPGRDTAEGMKAVEKPDS